MRPNTLPTLVLLLALTTLCSCRSSVPPVAFYTLSPVSAVSPEQTAQADVLAVGVGPLTIPRMIDRPTIVTRSAQGELHIDEFHRWAGTLESTVLDSLTQNIAQQLGSEQVVAYPWTNFIDPDYRVPIDILRLDGELGGLVTLEATWGVTPGKERRAAVVRMTTLCEQTTGGSYADLVAAHDRALETLAQMIATEIETLHAADQ
ncbi:MAG: PqiC family protein [Proteobacteria bacterium]|nr:PqiC family protein [Pseudomonadota bacterium]